MIFQLHGHSGRFGGGYGDVMALFEVQSHEHFVRRGDHLRTTVKVPLHIACLGGEVNVPTLGSSKGATVKIPEGTQFGNVLRCEGLGLPNKNNSIKGDLFVITEIDIPQSLEKEQKEAMISFANLVDKDYKYNEESTEEQSN
jgi:molecular chaperone DnaJ